MTDQKTIDEIEKKRDLSVSLKKSGRAVGKKYWDIVGKITAQERRKTTKWRRHTPPE